MKTTINYNKVAVCAMEGTATAVFANNKVMDKTAESNSVALLQVMKSLLNAVKPSNELMEKPVMIIVGSKSILNSIFITNSIVDYVRTGKTVSGKEFTEEEFALIKEVAQLYSSKLLNVRIVNELHIAKEDRATKTQINLAWERVKGLARNKMQKPNKPQANNTNANTNSTIETLSKKIEDAVLAGDLDLAERYTAMLTTLTNTIKRPAKSIVNKEVVEEEIEDNEEEIVVEEEQEEDLDDIADEDIAL